MIKNANRRKSQRLPREEDQKSKYIFRGEEKIKSEIQICSFVIQRCSCFASALQFKINKKFHFSSKFLS